MRSNNGFSNHYKSIIGFWLIIFFLLTLSFSSLPNLKSQVSQEITSRKKIDQQETDKNNFSPSLIPSKQDEDDYYILSEWSENFGTIIDIEIINTTGYFLTTNCFFTADVSNISSPQIFSKYFEVGNPRDCYITNQTAFIADWERGLLLINVSDPFNLRRKGQYLKDQYEQVIVSGEVAYLRSHGHIDFLNISDPDWTTRIRQYEVYCDDFALSDDQLIIAQNPENIIGLNVSNLDNLTTLLLHQTTTWIQKIELENNLLYFTYYNWSEDLTKFVVLNITNPFNISVAGETNYSSHIDDFLIQDNYCFLTNYEGVQIYDITNPQNITKVSQLTLKVSLRGLFSSRSYLFGNDYTYTYLYQVIDIRNITNPKIIHREPTGEVETVTISNGIAFLSKGVSGIAILNVTDAENPTKLGHWHLDIKVEKVIIKDQLAFFGCGKKGLFIYDIQNLTNPIKLGDFDNGQVDDFVITNDYAIIGDSEQGLFVVNVSEPTNPTQIGELKSSLLWGELKTRQQQTSSALSIYLYDSLICLTYETNFYFISINNLSNPILLYDETIGEIKSVTFIEQFMYMLVADRLIIYDINNTSAPKRMYNYRDYNYYEGIFVDDRKLILYGWFEVLVLNASNPKNLTQIDLLNIVESIRLKYCQIIDQSIFLSDGYTDLRIVSGDFDNDNLFDYFEVKDFGTDPNKADTDDDNLTDFEEIHEIGTNPLVADSDNDGFTDGEEVLWGSDPLDESSIPTIPPSTNPPATTQPSTENGGIPPWLIWFIGISSGVIVLIIISIIFIVTQRKINTIQMKKYLKEKHQIRQLQLQLYKYLISLKNKEKQTIDQICQHSDLSKEEIVSALHLWSDSGDLENIGSFDEQENQFIRRIVQRYPEGQAKCFYCEKSFNLDETQCPFCGFDVLRCSACNLPIQCQELFGLCPYCEAFFHFDHLLDYLETKDYCPNCNHRLQPTEIKLVTKPTLTPIEEED